MPPSPGDDPHAARAAPARRRLLALLHDRAGQDSRELAAATGLHVTTVRFHLQILERAGLVASRSDPQGRSGRPRTIYSAIDSDDTERLRRDLAAYQDLVGALAAHLADGTDSPGAAAQHAGAAWAARLAPARGGVATAAEACTRVQQMCAQLGFDPELIAEDGHWRMELRACPYRSVAREHREVVCGLHHGLIRGTLDEVGFPRLAVRLDPFIEPDLCIAHLGGAR